MKKLKVSFEITTSWNRGDFRQFIEELNKNDTVELFMITTETDQNLIDSVQATLELDNDHVFIATDNTDKEVIIAFNLINIHLDPDVRFSQELFETTGAYGINVSFQVDRYNLRMKYVTDFNTRLKEIIDEA